MLAKIKSAASVQTPGSAEAAVISNAKVSEHLGTTHGSINLVQTHSEKWRVNEQGKACRAVYDSVIYDSNMFIVKCICSVFVLVLGIIYLYYYLI